MGTWIALFRGINVGGRNVLPMAELRAELEALGCEDVRTYIQSGNAVFRSSARSGAKLGKDIAAALGASHDIHTPVLVISRADLEAVLEENPFPKVEEGKALHVAFLLAKPARPDLAGLASIATGTEAFELTKRALYLHAPDGIARSKLATRMDAYLGVGTTARNLNTVRKLRELAEAVEGGGG